MKTGSKFRSDVEIADSILQNSKFLDSSEIEENAIRLVNFCRENKSKRTRLDAFMEEYGLSNNEGIALMCLAESLLRIPDKKTRDDLIKEKITSAKWIEHLNQADSLLVNSATWGLIIAQTFLKPVGLESHWLKNLSNKIGEAPIREAVKMAMSILGDEFVCAKNISDLEHSTIVKNENCSFDMLGEAARNEVQALKFLGAYKESIHVAGKFNQQTGNDHGVSIKLSALYSKYDLLHQNDVNEKLLPRFRDLALLALEKDVSLTIDAEEQDRLTVSLDLIEKILLEKDIRDWEKIGVAVQAYGKRAFDVINHINQLGNKREKVGVRLVKGAYWDYEIKNAQKNGYPDYSVFTAKSLTDLNYLYCAKAMIDSSSILPCFATHNANTISSIMHLADGKDVSFQRLYGMGELLYQGCEKIFDQDFKTNVYCPIGEHKELLPYLVRRLLENGANASFVNQLFDENIPAEKVAQSPQRVVKEKLLCNKIKPIEIPPNMYGNRKNSLGTDLSEKESLNELKNSINTLAENAFNVTNLSSAEINSTNQIKISSPIDGKILGTYSSFNAEQDIIFQQSKQWAEKSFNDKAKVLLAVADHIESNPAKFLSLLVNESGKTYQDSVDEIREAIDFIRYYVEQAEDLFESKEMVGPTGEKNFLQHVPKGTVLCISPWNFPLAITAGQIIAALVTGNTVIAKPSEHTTIIAYEFIKLLLAKGVPDDAINLVLGDGKVGEHVIKSQPLDLVCFTGSLQTAKNIHQNLAQKSGQIVSLVAETGGLNAMVIDSSALLEQACDDVIRSAFMSAGQRCSALRIALIHEDVYQDFKAMLAGAMDDLVVGDPRETRTDVGPIISVDAATKIKAYVDLKRTEGFKIFCANENHAHTDQFIQPTFIEMSSLAEINEEIFGPVLHLVSFQEKNLEIVLQELKSKGFGLTFGVHSRIESKATKISKLVASGNSYINRDMIGAVVGTQPFGGSGLSGTGHKAGGPNYLIQFVNEKLVSINTVAIGGNAELLNLETENGNSQGT